MGLARPLSGASECECPWSWWLSSFRSRWSRRVYLGPSPTNLTGDAFRGDRRLLTPLARTWRHRRRDVTLSRSYARSQDRQLRMEPLWSPAVATRGNRWQMERPQKRLRQAQTVAVGCDQLPESFHGKEEVDGSRPSGESLHKSPANGPVVLPIVARFEFVVDTRRVHLGLAGTRGVARHSLGRAQDTRSPPLSREVPANRWSALSALARR